MGLFDEYSRDALFRRSDQEIYNSDSDCEESPEPLEPEDFDDMYSEEIYSDVCRIHEFVYDNCYRVKNRYGMAEYTELIHEPALFWEDIDIRLDVTSLWRRLACREYFDPQSFQTWLQKYVDIQ
jgi:hypothetical protein